MVSSCGRLFCATAPFRELIPFRRRNNRATRSRRPSRTSAAALRIPAALLLVLLVVFPAVLLVSLSAVLFAALLAVLLIARLVVEIHLEAHALDPHALHVGIVEAQAIEQLPGSFGAVALAARRRGWSDRHGIPIGLLHHDARNVYHRGIPPD